MATTATRRGPVSLDSEDVLCTSSATSVLPSVVGSLAASQTSSSTSLSSLGEEADKKPLLDTYGNVFELPQFTMKDIRDAIPAHCFERSYARSFGYVARDLVLLASTFYLFNTYTPLISSYPLRVAAWALYTFLQGLFGTGIWVLAHECGHGAFSPSKRVNDITGWVLHSALLVPFFSWKLSHSAHHKATGHMERDMVFVPRTREQYIHNQTGSWVAKLADLGEETPIVTAINLVLQQLVGWPMYLITNVTGHNYHERQREGRGKGKKNGWFGGANHFNPASPLYDNKHFHLIMLSDLGLAITLFALYTGVQKFGFQNMLVWYGLPYLWVNHWLVAITFLQHTDPTLPHYNPEAWNFARGAAATIDRDFGFIGRHLLHGIIETHVAHHYVSTIPFYNADEASDAIKVVMGSHYRAETRGGAFGFLKALWTTARWCNFLEQSEGAQGEGEHVLFFRNRNGLGVKPMDDKVFKSTKSQAKNQVIYHDDSD
ncbi:fatty acid desaturase-domain-containing protein [Peziza echinospora]|nr:fatty acid desaturase-domain-containing protein [Peziza echinospora]